MWICSTQHFGCFHHFSLPTSSVITTGRNQRVTRIVSFQGADSAGKGSQASDNGGKGSVRCASDGWSSPSPTRENGSL